MTINNKLTLVAHQGYPVVNLKLGNDYRCAHRGREADLQKGGVTR